MALRRSMRYLNMTILKEHKKKALLDTHAPAA